MKKYTTSLFAAAALFTLVLSTPATTLADNHDSGGDYPTEINNRPLTLPAGALEVNVGVNVAGFTTDISAGMDLGVSYGIMDGLDAGLTWSGMSFAPEVAANKQIGIGIAYSVLDTDAADLAVVLGVPLDFTGDPVKVFNNIGLGADFRYTMGDVAIHTGSNLLNFELENIAGDFGMAITLDLGIAYQASEVMNVRLDTHLVNIPVVGGGDITSIADATPIALTFGYELDNTMGLGLGVVIGDVQNAGDTMGVRLAFDWRML